MTLFLLLAAFVVQQFLPAFTGFHHSRILLVQLVFLCCAVTVNQPTMLLLAFVGGLLWDAHSALGPSSGDPAVYVQAVESLRFGYSVVLFAMVGFLMQGIQPLFQRGKWIFSAILTGIAVWLYLAVEYAFINFVRGDFVFNQATFLQMTFIALFTMLLSPLIFWGLYWIAKSCGHTIYPEASRRKKRTQ